MTERLEDMIRGLRVFTLDVLLALTGFLLAVATRIDPNRAAAPEPVASPRQRGAFDPRELEECGTMADVEAVLGSLHGLPRHIAQALYRQEARRRLFEGVVISGPGGES